MSQIHDLTALQQGAAIAAGELSTSEIIDHYAERIDRLNPQLGAYVTPTIEQAHAQADQVNEAGPLAGVPTAIKDLQATAGVRTTYGSVLMADHVPEVSDEVVLRIEAAGMPSLGKTATPEFGSPCYTEPEGYPPAVTPWDTTRMAGGSSGGAAAAVAAGLAPVAQGSDGGGSIRIPASCCGIVGLKPSRGRVSGAPSHGDVTGLAAIGPLARTVADAAAFLDVMAGPAVGDPTWAPEPATSFLSMCTPPSGPLKIGRFIEPVVVPTTVHPEIVLAWENASALLEELGHHVEDITPPISTESVATFETCWAVLTALSTSMVPDEFQSMLRPTTRWLGEWGQRISGPEFGLALGELRRIAAAALIATAEYDVVLTPTLAQPPLPVGALRDDDDPAADFLAQKEFTPWTSLWNVTGSTAISLPLHHTHDGLPVGVMLAAAPTREDLILSLATQLEQAAPWLGRTPECW